MIKLIIAVICGLYMGNTIAAVEINSVAAKQAERLRLSDRSLQRDFERLYRQQFGLPVSWLVYRIAESDLMVLRLWQLAC